MSFSVAQPPTISTGVPVVQVSSESHPFQYVQQCYDPASPHYRFRFFFYNPGPAANVAKSPLVSDRLWQQALADNPDPANFHPVLANGFGDLQRRVAWQESQMTAQLDTALALDEELDGLARQQEIQFSSQLAKIRTRQAGLNGRMTKLVVAVDGLRKSKMNSSTAPACIALKERLGEIGTKLKAVQLDNLKILMAEQSRATAEESLVIADEAARTQLAHLIFVLQSGIRALMGAVKQDLAALERMRNDPIQ